MAVHNSLYAREMMEMMTLINNYCTLALVLARAEIARGGLDRVLWEVETGACTVPGTGAGTNRFSWRFLSIQSRTACTCSGVPAHNENIEVK